MPKPSLDRYDNYRQITARFAGQATCGHPIRKGDVIGWNVRLHKTQCADCWRKWSAEVREEAAAEAGIPCY
jgi:hypothetical protein